MNGFLINKKECKNALCLSVGAVINIHIFFIMFNLTQIKIVQFVSPFDGRITKTLNKDWDLIRWKAYVARGHLSRERGLGWIAQTVC